MNVKPTLFVNVSQEEGGPGIINQQTIGAQQLLLAKRFPRIVHPSLNCVGLSPNFMSGK